MFCITQLDTQTHTNGDIKLDTNYLTHPIKVKYKHKIRHMQKNKIEHLKTNKTFRHIQLDTNVTHP
jgi:hypothetical protein